MKTLNLNEMEAYIGGQVSCTLMGRSEYGGMRISSWSCSNGDTMTNISVMNDEGMWDVLMSF